MPLEKILNNMLNTGLVGGVHEVPYVTDEPKFFSYLAYPSKEITDKESIHEMGQGLSDNNQLAEVKATGECIERLCLKIPRINLEIKEIYEPNSNKIDPTIFRVYSEEQVDIDEYNEAVLNGEYSWIDTLNLKDNKKYLIPAQLVYLTESLDNEVPIRGERISTGAALGKIGSNMALKNAFFEVIERDSTISSYLKKRKLDRITGLSKDINNLVKKIERYNLEVNIFDITTDLEIPSVMCIILDRTGIGEAVNIGSSSAENYSSAIKKALFESIQCRRGSRIRRELSNGKYEEKKILEKEIRSIEDRFSYSRPLERINDINYWLNSNNKISLKELEKKEIRFDKAINNVVKKGYDIFVIDISLPKVKENNLECKKVLIPQLHPLYLSEDAKALYSIHYGTIKKDPHLKPHLIS